MGTILDQLEGPDGNANSDEQPVRCPFCGRGNISTRRCRHVRWTFDLGGPIEFAQHAVEVSPYTSGRGYSLAEIPDPWWNIHGEKVLELIDLHFGVDEGFVFGDLVDLDILARDIWRIIHPEMATADHWV